MFCKKEKSKNQEDLLKEYVSLELFKQIERIKPKIKKRVIILVEKEKILLQTEPKGIINAFWLSPYIIIFFESLIATFKEIISDNIIEMLKHEIVHSMGIRDEIETTKTEKQIDIFKK